MSRPGQNPVDRCNSAAGSHSASLCARLASRLVACLVLFALLLGLAGDVPPGAPSLDLLLSKITDGSRFEFALWEAQALAAKLGETIERPEKRFTPTEQRDLVLAYIDAIGEISRLKDTINGLHATLDEESAAAASAPYEAELNDLRALQSGRVGAVQRILQAQVTSVIAEQGLTTAGLVFPPLSFHFTESPDYLIVSPRDRIYVERGVYLRTGIDLAEIEAMERLVETTSGRSALVEGTGGFSSYPTMIIETPDLFWILSTIAHEWGHTYLFFRPLGWHYYDSGDMRTFNETAVSILGDEIAELTIAKYYPEYAARRDWPRPHSLDPAWWDRTTKSETFEFGAFMRETRLQVDDYLAAGRVDDAEIYMEERRQLLREKGYLIRRLNQAYFAFHGSYAVGTSATDPIGGKLRALRAERRDLASFIQTIERMTSVAQLDQALDFVGRP